MEKIFFIIIKILMSIVLVLPFASLYVLKDGKEKVVREKCEITILQVRGIEQGKSIVYLLSLPALSQDPDLHVPISGIPISRQAPDISYLIPHRSSSGESFYYRLLILDCDEELLLYFESVLANISRFPMNAVTYRNRIGLMDEHGGIIGLLGRDDENGGGTESRPWLEESVSLSTDDQRKPVIINASKTGQRTTVDIYEDFMSNSAEAVSLAIIMFGKLVVKGIDTGASKYISSSSSAASNQESQPSSNESQIWTFGQVIALTPTHLETFKNVTGKMLAVSQKGASLFADTVGKTSDWISSKLFPDPATTPNDDTCSNRPFKRALEASLKSFYRIDEAFDSTLSLIGKKFIQSTDKVVQHKYGNETAAIVKDGLETVQNVALVYIDAKGISRKAFIKKTGKSVLMRMRLKDGKIVTVKPLSNEELYGKSKAE